MGRPSKSNTLAIFVISLIVVNLVLHVFSAGKWAAPDSSKQNVVLLTLQKGKQHERRLPRPPSHSTQQTNATRILPQNTTEEVTKTDSSTSTTSDHTPPPVVIAYAISVSSCYANSTNVFDGAAVLAHSIHRSSIRNHDAETEHHSKYDYRLYAFVHPSADETCVRVLQFIGYDVQIRDTPFRIAEIRNEELQKAIQENGCCGEKEFLKLYAYTLDMHEIAVHMDLDTFVLQPMDELFDAMLGIGGAQPRSSRKATMRNKKLPKKIGFLYTRDYLAKSTMHKDPSKYAVQGGFLVLRTNTTLFNEMIQVILNGAGFSRMMGWGGKLYAGYWGSAQIQGFLSYFYGELHPQAAVELNRCVYNTMAKDDPYFSDGKTCRTGEATCEDCRETPIHVIKTAHLTTCWKPWQCPQLPKKMNPPLCHALHHEWFGLRRSLEQEWGLELPPVDSGYNYKRYFGYCEKVDIKVVGKKALYVPMKFPNRTTPD